jgi:hypothetical protein
LENFILGIEISSQIQSFVCVFMPIRKCMDIGFAIML